MKQALILLSVSSVHLVLTLTAALAGVLFSTRRGVSRPVTLLGIGMATAGAVALSSFWAYYGSLAVAPVWTWGLFVLSAVLVLTWRSGRRAAGVRELGTAVALWVVGT